MNETVSQNQHAPSHCPLADAVAAYIDGELDPQASLLFEQHTRECAACASALNEQKRLLCVLDAALGAKPEKEFELPKEFARVVAAHARTDMSGVRRRPEHRRALALVALLASAAFGLLGTGLGDVVFQPFAGAARSLAGVFRMATNALADAGAGAAVILRAFGGRLVAEPDHIRFLALALFACALVLLLRLIGGYHRARVRE